MYATNRFRQYAFASLACACIALACTPERTVTANDNAVNLDNHSASVINNVAAGSRTALGVRDSARLVATGATKRGRVVRWESSNGAVIRVNSQGLAVAEGVGVATITATGFVNEQHWTFDVGKTITTITALPDSVSVEPGATLQLAVVLSAVDGTVITGRRTQFTSVNTTVATVSQSGLIAARVAGKTFVVVSAGNVSRSIPVVSAVAVTPPVTPPTTPPVTPPTTPPVTPPTTPPVTPPTTPPVTPPTTPPVTPPTSGALGLNAALAGATLFPLSNPWNQPVDTAQVDPNSAAIIANIGATKSFHPDFGANYNGGPFGIPYYVVSGTQTGVNVTFDYDDESDHGLYPIPANAPIEGGAASSGDRHVIIVDRDRWKLYELYAAYPQGNGNWHAGSGAVFDLTSNALRPAGWTSADAAGLPILPGLVRYDEVVAGNIAHAIRFTVSRSRKAYIPPARHWASSDTSSLRPPMGMRVRLKASVNIAGYSANAQTILRALKKYGMIVADNGSDWYASGTADARWNDNELNALKALKGSDFEVVRITGVVKP